jgi:hypothetical protein
MGLCGHWPPPPRAPHREPFWGPKDVYSRVEAAVVSSPPNGFSTRTPP